MISEEQEWEPAPDVDMADTHDLPAPDPDAGEGGEGGSIENEGPEPSQRDANGPGPDEPEGGESEAGESEAGADDPQPGETVDKEQDNGNAGEEEPDGEEAEPAEMKIVLHVRNGRANAGVWRPGADPHLEVFLETDPDVLLSELPGVVERAQARWAENPMRPKYSPPKTPRKKPKPNQTRQPADQQPVDQQPEPDQPRGRPAAATEQHGPAFLNKMRLTEDFMEREVDNQEFDRDLWARAVRMALDGKNTPLRSEMRE